MIHALIGTIKFSKDVIFGFCFKMASRSFRKEATNILFLQTLLHLFLSARLLCQHAIALSQVHKT